MSINPQLKRVTAGYSKDDGTVVLVDVDVDTATNGQFGIPSGSEPIIEEGLKMRSVTLVGADGSKKTLKCGALDADAWTQGKAYNASFWDGAYDGTGAKRGEHRRAMPKLYT